MVERLVSFGVTSKEEDAVLDSHDDVGHKTSLKDGDDLSAAFRRCSFSVSEDDVTKVANNLSREKPSLIVDKSERKEEQRKSRSWLTVGLMLLVLSALGLLGYFGLTRREERLASSPVVVSEEAKDATDDSMTTDSGSLDSSPIVATMTLLPTKKPAPAASNGPTQSPSVPVTDPPTKEEWTLSPTPAPVEDVSVINPSTSSGPPTRSPTYPYDKYWRQVSPHLTIDDTALYGYSASLSADGRRLAVLHSNGFSVYENEGQSTSIWRQPLGARNGATRAELLLHLGLEKDVFAEGSLTTALIELNFNGDRLIVHVGLVDGGRAAAYGRDDAAGWVIISEAANTVPSPTSAGVYGDAAAYARGQGRRFVAGSRVSELDESTGRWNTVLGDLKDSVVIASGPSTTSLFDEIAAALGVVGGGFGGENNGLFGASVAISPDGESVAVASPTSPVMNIDTVRPSGEIDVFDGDDATLRDDVEEESPMSLSGNVFVYWDYLLLNLFPYWRQRGQALSASPDSNHFGTVVMSKNGARIAVGTPNDRHDDARGGTVHVFDYTSSARQWRWVGTIREAQLRDDDDEDAVVRKTHFGRALAMSELGTHLAVLAPKERREGGRVCVYAQLSDRSTSWSRVGNCLAPGHTDDSVVSRFSMSFSGDGDRLAVGVPRNNSLEDNNGAGSVSDLRERGGHVTVYELTKL